MPSHQLPYSHQLQSGGEITGLPLQKNHSDCSRMVQHTLVWGSNGHVKPDPPVPAQSTNTPFKPDSSQESVKPKSACLALSY